MRRRKNIQTEGPTGRCDRRDEIDKTKANQDQARNTRQGQQTRPDYSIIDTRQVQAKLKTPTRRQNTKTQVRREQQEKSSFSYPLFGGYLCIVASQKPV